MFAENRILTRLTRVGRLLTLLVRVGTVLTSRTCRYFLLRWWLIYLWELLANMRGVVQAIARFNFFLFYRRCKSWIFFSNIRYRISSKASIPIFRKSVFNLVWRRCDTCCINGILPFADESMIFLHVFEPTLIQNWTSCFAHAKELLINWLHFFCSSSQAVDVGFLLIWMLFLFMDNIEGKTWPAIVFVSTCSQSCCVPLILPRLICVKLFYTDTILACSHISKVDSRIIHRVSHTLADTLKNSTRIVVRWSLISGGPCR